MTTETQLETLEAKGLIRLATVRPELEYLFRHALVQDAAYGSLLKQERRELHGQVGEALEALYPDRLGELAPVLAMHFDSAGQVEKAIDYYASGGKQAARQGAIQEAFGAFDRAATLSDQEAGDDPIGAEETARRRRRRVVLELGKARAGYSFRSPEEEFAALEAIVDDAEKVGDPALIGELHTMVAMARLQNGESPENPELARSLQRLRELGQATGDPSIEAIPKALVGTGQVFAGSVRDGVAALEESLPLLEDLQESIGAAFARGALAIGYATLGEFEKADAASARATELAAGGDLIAQLDALIAAGYVQSAKGELEAAVPIASECVERAEATGASACIVVSSWILGDAFHRQGRFAEARDVLQRGADVSLVVDRKVWRPTLQAWLGSSLVALGDPTAAKWDEALAAARSIGNRSGEAQILWKRGEAAAASGDTDAAIIDLRASAELFEAGGARPFLARVYREWGRTLLRAGRRDEADPLLRRSLALFEELGLEREAGITRTAIGLGGATLAFDERDSPPGPG